MSKINVSFPNLEKLVVNDGLRVPSYYGFESLEPCWNLSEMLNVLESLSNVKEICFDNYSAWKSPSLPVLVCFV